MLQDLISGKAELSSIDETSNSKVKSLILKSYYLFMTVVYSFCGLFID